MWTWTAKKPILTRLLMSLFVVNISRLSYKVAKKPKAYMGNCSVRSSYHTVVHHWSTTSVCLSVCLRLIWTVARHRRPHNLCIYEFVCGQNWPALLHSSQEAQSLHKQLRCKKPRTHAKYFISVFFYQEGHLLSYIY